MQCYRSKKCHIFLGIIGLLFVIAGALLIGLKVADKVIDNQLNKQLMLSLDSAAYSQWVDPAPPIYMQYWIFNVTNANEAMKGAKPIVEEIGPFTYRMHQYRTDIAFYGNRSVSYKYNHTLFFEKDMSPYSISTKIYQLNIPLITVQTLIKDLPGDVLADIMDLLAAVLDDSNVFVQHTAEDLLFGYNDPLLDVIHDILQVAEINFPPQFGLFLGFNNSDDGVYLVDSGKYDIMNVNLIQKWNGNKSLSYWSTPSANMINGTDGIFMTPKVNKSQTLYIYNTDLCRSVYLTFEKETKVRGIKTYRFKLPGEVFGNVSTNPDNAGFCVPSGNCFDAGVLSISSCKQGAPALISSPHFYLAAEKYINGVVGMKPAKKYHQTFLDIEPMSGAVFSAMKRVQLNIHVKDYGLFYQLKQIKEVIFPVAWINESVYLDAGSANTFKSEVLGLIHVVHAIPYVILSLGVVFMLIGFGLMFYYYAKDSKSQPLLSDNDSGNEEESN